MGLRGKRRVMISTGEGKEGGGGIFPSYQRQIDFCWILVILTSYLPVESRSHADVE